jgi:hypothetical protein
LTATPTVIVSGTIAATPWQGGATWAVLQYLLGLRRLGCGVYFVEQLDGEADLEAVRYCEGVMERFDLSDRWAILPDAGEEPIGMSGERLVAAAGESELLLNLSGKLADAEVLDRVPIRTYMDLDPAFAQLWQATEGVDMGFDAHTHFVSVADTIGEPDSPIPDCGREWLPTLPPVVLSEWPVASELERRRATTVGHWRSYGSITHDGVHYGQKAHSLRALIDLPRRAPERFEVALAIHPDETGDLEALEENGWDVLDPGEVAATPEDYRSFVQGSWAEFGLAKLGYVASDSGWFSDRSACYLASGRPVLAQDTGFNRRLPTGEGLLAFSDADDVVEGLERLEDDYQQHRAAARRIAEEHLESDLVLSSLLERLLS